MEGSSLIDLTMTANNEIKTRLSECELFAGISSEALDEIASIAEKKDFKAGTTICRGGESRNNCYIIFSGAVELFRNMGQKAEYGLIKLEVGGSFGEFCLLSKEPISGSARAIENSTMIILRRETFEPIVMKYPEVLHAVGKKASRWIQTAGSVFDQNAHLRAYGHRMTLSDFFFIICLSCIFALVYNKANPNGISLFTNEQIEETISFVRPLNAFIKAQNNEVLFIDAMPSGFYEKGHIKGAMNLPLATFDFMYDLTLADVDKTKGIIIYGRTISKHYDVEVANKLVIRGYKNIMILEGGLDIWRRTGLPVEP